MASNFFDSGFDEFFGELANYALPLPLPLPSPAASNRRNSNQSTPGHPPLELPRLHTFGLMPPLPPVPASGLPSFPRASPWYSRPWQPTRQPAQAGALSSTAASFISGPTFSRGAPHPPTPMPSTAPASLPSSPFFQSATTASAQFAPANPPQPQRPQRTVNNLSFHNTSHNTFHNTSHNTSRTITPPTQQREPNSDDFFLNQFTPDFSSPSLPSGSASPQRPSHRTNNSSNNNPLGGTRLPRILPLSAVRATPVAPPAGLRVPPPPATRSTPTSNTHEEDSDSDSADNMPGSNRPTRGRRPTPSSTAQQLALPRASRNSGASSSSSAATASAQQQENSSKYQSNQSRIARQTSRRRASNASVSATGSASKRKREEFELDLDDDDLFGDKDLEVIDLVDKDVPDMTPEEKEREEDKKKNWVKLSRFQCVICMDDVTDLTVTYCGHLFCSECLHSALQISPHKRVCPICRQKIENKNASGKFGPKAKGYYPLEIKLMTKKSLGKRAAASRSNNGEH